MKRIILVRHGQNSMVGKRLAGWLPGVHLNDVGKSQAAALAERFGAQKGQIQALYSSPVTRCQETARPLASALGLEVQTLDGVGEVLYGDWEGESIFELAKLDEWKIVQGFPSAMRFPGGERMRDVQMRAVAAVEEVASRLKDTERAIIVSHADVIKSIAAHYAGIHFDLFQRLVISAASITIIGLTSYAPRIICLNDCAHIPPGKDPELRSNNNSAQQGEPSRSPGDPSQSSISGVNT
ncbi:MAG: MSMEG_4193 family putative phosphomutase [Ardenticatenaceae bacterium]